MKMFNNHHKIALLLSALSPIIGFILYLPSADMAYGNLDPLNGFIYGPMIIVPCIIIYFIICIIKGDFKDEDK